MQIKIIEAGVDAPNLELIDNIKRVIVDKELDEVSLNNEDSRVAAITAYTIYHIRGFMEGLRAIYPKGTDFVHFVNDNLIIIHSSEFTGTIVDPTTGIKFTVSDKVNPVTGLKSVTRDDSKPDTVVDAVVGFDFTDTYYTTTKAVTLEMSDIHQVANYNKRVHARAETLSSIKEQIDFIYNETNPKAVHYDAGVMVISNSIKIFEYLYHQGLVDRGRCFFSSAINKMVIDAIAGLTGKDNLPILHIVIYDENNTMEPLSKELLEEIESKTSGVTISISMIMRNDMNAQLDAVPAVGDFVYAWDDDMSYAVYRELYSIGKDFQVIMVDGQIWEYSHCSKSMPTLEQMFETTLIDFSKDRELLSIISNKTNIANGVEK